MTHFKMFMSCFEIGSFSLIMKCTCSPEKGCSNCVSLHYYYVAVFLFCSYLKGRTQEVTSVTVNEIKILSITSDL